MAVRNAAIAGLHDRENDLGALIDKGVNVRRERESIDSLFYRGPMRRRSTRLTGACDPRIRSSPHVTTLAAVITSESLTLPLSTTGSTPCPLLLGLDSPELFEARLEPRHLEQLVLEILLLVLQRQALFGAELGTRARSVQGRITRG